MPAITDKFNQATTTGRPSPAALTAVKTIGATSITVDSTAEWATDTAVHFIIYEVDANNDKVAGTQCDFKGIVNSATTINNLTLKAGTDREYPIGSKVIAAPTAAWADDVVEGLVVSLNQDGTLKDNSVVTANITDANVTTAKLADASVTGAKLAHDNIIFASFTPSTNSNITSASYVDLSGSTSITVPTWATRAFIQCNAHQLYNVSNDSIITLRPVIGTDTGTAHTTYFDTIGDTSAVGFSFASDMTITSTGSKTLKIEARRDSGTGALRTATNTPITFIIFFMA